MMRLLYLDVLLFFCFGAMAFLLYYRYFDTSLYEYLYYVMIKAVDLGLSGGILMLMINPVPLERSRVFAWKGLVIFFIIRLAWQVFELENKPVANHPKIIDCLFIADVAIVIIILIKNRKRL